MRQVFACVVGALASGLLLLLALPLGEQAYLAWIALVPLLVATRGRGFLVGFLSGLAAIFFAAWLSVIGIFYRHLNSEGSPAWVYTGFGIFGFTLSIVVGAWADRATERISAWWFAALAVLLEASMLVQLPAHLALTQYGQGMVLQVASIGGIWLVSFLVWLCNFYLAGLKGKSLMVGAGLVCLGSVILGFFHPRAHGDLERFSVVQIAEPDDLSEAKMHMAASKARPEFVVWPEFGGIPFASMGDTSALRKLTGKAGASAVITSFQDNFRPLHHNVAALFDKGKESVRYEKRKLFGAETKMHTPGSAAVATPFSGGVVGLNVCFDSCYPEIIRETARLPGVNVIAVPSSDPFASNYFISAMHAAYTPFRAAEEGVAVVKGDGMAYSQVVGPFGEIVAEAPPGDRVMTGAVSVSTHWTVYKQFGDWFLWLAGVLVVYGLWKDSVSRKGRPVWSPWPLAPLFSLGVQSDSGTPDESG